MNNLQEFTNGDIKFDAERSAIGLGISTVAKSGNNILLINSWSQKLLKRNRGE